MTSKQAKVIEIDRYLAKGHSSPYSVQINVDRADNCHAS
jgi:hypothetical protein